MSDHAFGLWAGLAVDNTAEATAAGALYSDAAGKFAVLAKTARNATIGFVVLGYAIHWARQSQAKKIDNKKAHSCGKSSPRIHPRLPGDFDARDGCGLSSPSRRPPIWRTSHAGRSFLTFAGVGLQTNLREMRKQGLRPLKSSAR